MPRHCFSPPTSSSNPFPLHPRQRLNEDICTLSTLGSSYKKLSPTTEFPPMRLLSPTQDSEHGDVLGILNLLKMWQAGGQLQDPRISGFLNMLSGSQVGIFKAHQ